MVLAPAREYEPGSYYVYPDAIVVEPGQTRGRTVAGPPRAVRAALEQGVFDAVWTVSIEGNSARKHNKDQVMAHSLGFETLFHCLLQHHRFQLVMGAAFSLGWSSPDRLRKPMSICAQIFIIIAYSLCVSCSDPDASRTNPSPATPSGGDGPILSAGADTRVEPSKGGDTSQEATDSAVDMPPVAGSMEPLSGGIHAGGRPNMSGQIQVSVTGGGEAPAGGEPDTAGQTAGDVQSCDVSYPDRTIGLGLSSWRSEDTPSFIPSAVWTPT